MRTAIIAAALAAVAAPAAFAQDAAEPRQYLAFGGVYAAASDYAYSDPQRVTADIDAGFGLSAAYGGLAGNNLRWEAAFAMSWQELQTTGYNGPRPPFWPAGLPWNETYRIADGELGLYRLTANGYYDFMRSGPVRPYVGVGLGVASVDLADGVVEGVGSAFTGEVIAGVSTPVSKSTSLFVDVRYVHVGPIQVDSDLDEDADSDFDLGGAQASAGVRVHF
jgi:opacity protein-like surface antigen